MDARVGEPAHESINHGPGGDLVAGRAIAS
jgi:hypothetical protein